MSSSSLRTLIRGFSRTFWVANTLELFERFAFYGSKAVLTIYLAQRVGLGPEAAGSLAGIFSGVLYFLPVLAGTVVDRYGFKRSLAACFSIFCVGYFLIGLAGLNFGQSIVAAIGKGPYIFAVLMLTAVGGSLIKPSIVGTVARTSAPEAKSLGYSIYYTLVNIGGALGPILALGVRENLGIEYVLIMSSVTSFFLLLGTLLFFREPERAADEPAPTSFAKVLRDMLTVFRDARFLGFLAVFSGFWIMFWQIFYSLPFYLTETLKFERFELIETVDAWTLILLTVPISAHGAALAADPGDDGGVRRGLGVLGADRPVSVAADGRRRHVRLRVRRGYAGAALLRVRGRPRAARAGGHLHGLRLPAGGDRLVRGRPARRAPRAALRA